MSGRKRQKKIAQLSSRSKQRDAERRGQSHTARVSMVVPMHEALRPGQGAFTFNAQANTDISLISEIFLQSLSAMGYTRSPGLLAGAVSSVVNALYPEVRKAIVQMVMRGSTIRISPELEDGGIKVAMEPFYESLLSLSTAEQQGKEAELWTPGQE